MMPSQATHEDRIRELEEKSEGVLQTLEAHGRALEALSETVRKNHREVVDKLNLILSRLH